MDIIPIVSEFQELHPYSVKMNTSLIDYDEGFPSIQISGGHNDTYGTSQSIQIYNTQFLLSSTSCHENLDDLICISIMDF